MDNLASVKPEEVTLASTIRAINELTTVADNQITSIRGTLFGSFPVPDSTEPMCDCAQDALNIILSRVRAIVNDLQFIKEHL